MEPDELARRLEKLERELLALREEVRMLRMRETQVDYAVASAAMTEVKEHGDSAAIVEEMRRRGILSAPTADEVALADEWSGLSAEERRAHIELMHSLDFAPSLSEIVLQNRR
jgi:hypothetical protein